MVLSVSVYLIILFDLINILLSRSFVFILLCGAFIVLVLVFLSGLSSATHTVASLAQPAKEDVVFELRVIYRVVVCAFVFFSESLPGDDVLCRLLSRFLPHL